MTISCMADSECTPEAFLNPVKDPSGLVIDPKGFAGITHKGAEEASIGDGGRQRPVERPPEDQPRGRVGAQRSKMVGDEVGGRADELIAAARPDAPLAGAEVADDGVPIADLNEDARAVGQARR